MNLSKFVLSLVGMILVGWIGKDVYQLSADKKNSQYKLHYLDGLHTEEEINKLTTFIKNKSKAKASLNQYYNRTLRMHSNYLSLKDTLNWQKYIDTFDLEIFQKETSKIPRHNTSTTNCNHIRNKIIRYLLLKYISYKVGFGNHGDCWGRYSQLKDNNNILVIEQCSNMGKEATVNGIKPNYYSDRSFKILISDTLNVMTKYYNKTQAEINP